MTVNSVDKGMHIRSILMVVQEGGSAIVSWADKPLKSPQDMVGHSIASTADQKPLIELLLTANKVPIDQVTIRIVSMQARNTVFYQHQVDGIVSVVIGSPMDMIVAAKEGKAAPIYLMPFSDFGIRTMATGAVVHDDTITSKPGLVQGFTSASLKAMNEIANEATADEACDIAMALSQAPANRREVGQAAMARNASPAADAIYSGQAAGLDEPAGLGCLHRSFSQDQPNRQRHPRRQGLHQRVH